METRTNGTDVLVESEPPLASMSPLDNLMSQVQGNGASVPPFPPIHQTINQVQGNGASTSQFPPTNQALNENGTSTPFDLFRHVTARPKTKQATRGQVSTEEPLGALGNVTTTPGGFCNEIDQEQLERENDNQLIEQMQIMVASMKSDLKKEITSHLEELIGKTINQSVEVSIETKLRPLQQQLSYMTQLLMASPLINPSKGHSTCQQQTQDPEPQQREVNDATSPVPINQSAQDQSGQPSETGMPPNPLVDPNPAGSQHMSSMSINRHHLSQGASQDVRNIEANLPNQVHGNSSEYPSQMQQHMQPPMQQPMQQQMQRHMDYYSPRTGGYAPPQYTNVSGYQQAGPP